MNKEQLKTFRIWWYTQVRNEYKPHIRLPGDSLLQLTANKEETYY